MSCGIASGLLSFLAPRLCPSCGEVVLGVGEEVCRLVLWRRVAIRCLSVVVRNAEESNVGMLEVS